MAKKPPPPAKPNSEPDYYNTVSEDLFVDKFIAGLERRRASKAQSLPETDGTTQRLRTE